MKAGVGSCNEKDAVSSGKRVIEDAIKNGGITRPDLVFAFCGGDVDHDEFLKGLKSALGRDVPVIGGSAIGIITNDFLSYEGHPSGVLVLESDSLEARVATAGKLNEDETMAGESVAKILSSRPDDKVLLIFYDSIKIPAMENTPPVMNASPSLIKGIEQGLDSDLPIIGAGLLGHFDFRPTKQFCGSYVGDQSVVAAILTGEFEIYSRIMHGCTLKDGIYYTITKIEGQFLYELDGRPVVEVIDNMYGSKNWRDQIPLKRLTIGVNYGERYGDFQEKNYVNRLISGVLPDGEGIVIFEPDLDEGTEIQFMLRDSRKTVESVENNVIEIMEKIEADGRRPAFGLYIDCAGRTASFSDTLSEEAALVQEVFNQYKTPLFGFYSGVEIAPLLGKSRGLDWTGVLLIVAEE